MLNYRSNPSYDQIFIKIAIWGANLVLCSAPKFGPHPGGSYGGQGGLSFYVGAKGMQWSQISHRKLKISISHGVVILASESDTMLNSIIINIGFGHQTRACEQVPTSLRKMCIFLNQIQNIGFFMNTISLKGRLKNSFELTDIERTLVNLFSFQIPPTNSLART